MSKKKRTQQYLRHTDHIQETPLILIKRKDNYIRVRVQVLRFHAFERTKPPVEGRQGIHTHNIFLDRHAQPCLPVPRLRDGRKDRVLPVPRVPGGPKGLSPASPQGTWWPKRLNPASPQGT